MALNPLLMPKTNFHPNRACFGKLKGLTKNQMDLKLNDKIIGRASILKEGGPGNDCQQAYSQRQQCQQRTLPGSPKIKIFPCLSSKNQTQPSY